jgi:hypothetical protein
MIHLGEEGYLELTGDIMKVSHNIHCDYLLLFVHGGGGVSLQRNEEIEIAS